MNTYKKRKNYFINNGISIEITHNRNVLVADYIDNIKFKKFWAGDLEINESVEIYNINIVVYSCIYNYKD